jgi:hypothetical protein
MKNTRQGVSTVSQKHPRAARHGRRVAVAVAIGAAASVLFLAQRGNVSLSPTAERAAAPQEIITKTSRTFPNVRVVAPARRTASGASGAGFVAAKDPVTGELRAPTAEEVRDLTAQPEGNLALGRAAGVETHAVRGAAAGSGMVLGDEHDAYLVATTGADGKLTLGHVRGTTEVSGLVQSGASTPGKELRDDR